MTRTVKKVLAKKRRRARNQRVNKKTAKIDARASPAEKARFKAACQRRGVPMAVALSALVDAYCKAVEEGRSTDLPLEVRSKSDA